MKRSEVYDEIRDWIKSHGYDEGYILQARFWNEKSIRITADTLSYSKTAGLLVKKQ